MMTQSPASGDGALEGVKVLGQAVTPGCHSCPLGHPLSLPGQGLGRGTWVHDFWPHLLSEGREVAGPREDSPHDARAELYPLPLLPGPASHLQKGWAGGRNLTLTKGKRRAGLGFS